VVDPGKSKHVVVRREEVPILTCYTSRFTQSHNSTLYSLSSLCSPLSCEYTWSLRYPRLSNSFQNAASLTGEKEILVHSLRPDAPATGVQALTGSLLNLTELRLKDVIGRTARRLQHTLIPPLHQHRPSQAIVLVLLVHPAMSRMFVSFVRDLNLLLVLPIALSALY
jgi:hypothetical protein